MVPLTSWPKQKRDKYEPARFCHLNLHHMLRRLDADRIGRRYEHSNRHNFFQLSLNQAAPEVSAKKLAGKVGVITGGLDGDSLS